jgi:hypothetical protein
MRRLMLAVATVVATVAVPAASAQTPAGDSVTGRATSCELDIPGSECNFFTFLDVDARSGPSGENATGTVEWQRRVSMLFLSGGGLVSCLAVSGNTAIVGATATGSAGSSRTLARVVDGGGAPGQDSFEAFTEFSFSSPPPPPQPPDCSSFPPNWGGLVQRASGVNDLGNIVVTDAQPLPTSKDQCKNGGWKTYRTFRNQGDCVSFVATGGRNQPSGP